MSAPHQDDVERLERHYAALFSREGDSPQAAQWSDRATQERRFALLAEIGPAADAAILDFGCGTGHLLEYLRRERQFTGEYTGYDLSAEMIAAARGKFPGVTFERRNIFADGVDGDFDYAFISGVFNNPVADNEKFMHDVLRLLFQHVRRGLAFNALSAYVDFFDANLSYKSPEQVFRFCKEALSPLVTLRHDYLVKPGVVPYEFTIYVHCSDLKPRAALQT